MDLRRRPVLAAVLGAACIANSAVFVRLADVAPGTAAFYRFLYALPVLGLLALQERRRIGSQPPAQRRACWAAGTLLAVDMVLWHHAIAYVGVGLATVLGNLQVVFVALVAWLLLHERPRREFLVALPLVLFGVLLISGLIERGAYGDEPLLGVAFGGVSSLCYAGFLLLFRHATDEGHRLATPLYEATLAAAVVTVPVALLAGGLDLEPSWPAHGWLVLLALTCQVLGWLAIAISLPRLQAALGSLLLLLQPLTTVVLGALLFSESPTWLQVSGCVMVLGGAVYAARTPADAAPIAPADTELIPGAAERDRGPRP